MNARFLIAKYAPDLKRMEPRNIGVIVWIDGQVVARFLGEGLPANRVDAPLRVGIRDKETYRRWIASWRRQLAKPYLEGDRGEEIQKRSVGYIDALKTWSRGNYMLVDGGVLAETVAPTEAGELADYLFQELVAVESDDKPATEAQQLKADSERLLAKSGVSTHPEFQHEWPGVYRLANQSRFLRFDGAIGPIGRPYSLYQRVVLERQHEFDYLALSINAFRNETKYPQERTFALIIEPKKTAKPDSLENLSLLARIATVVDVANESKAEQHLKAASLLNGSP